MSDGDNTVEIVYEGDINFNEDETAIQSISPRGYLRYRKNGDRLLAGNNDSGVVEYELSVNGRILDPRSEEGKAFLSRAIKKMLDLGFDLDGRIDRLYHKGGIAALLSEVDSVDGDYAKGRYLERILETDSLPPAMVTGVVDRIRDRMESAYDKERLLSKVDAGYLKNDSVAMDYLAAAKTIDGDYERGLAVRDYLRGEVKEGPLFDSLLSVVNQTEGDYEKGNLLRAMIRQDIRREQSWAGLIKSAAAMDGDYEKSNLLVEIGRRLPKSDSLRGVYMVAAKSVHSDTDYGRVVRALDGAAPRDGGRDAEK